MNTYFIINIPEIESKTSFWFVRTNGGKRYDEFINENRIGVSLNEDIDSYYVLARHRKVMGQFNEKLSIGDVVLVPSEGKNSRTEQMFSIGIIESDSYQLNSSKESLVRNVRWIRKDIIKDNSTIFLQKLFYNHRTISNITPYATYVEQMMYPIYYKDNSIVITTQVRADKDINQKDLVDFLSGPYLINNVENLTVTSKTVLQSPGIISTILSAENLDYLYLALPYLVIMFSSYAKRNMFKKKFVKLGKFKFRIKIGKIIDVQTEIEDLSIFDEKSESFEKANENLKGETVIDGIITESTEDEDNI